MLMLSGKMFFPFTCVCAGIEANLDILIIQVQQFTVFKLKISHRQSQLVSKEPERLLSRRLLWETLLHLLHLNESGLHFYHSIKHNLKRLVEPTSVCCLENMLHVYILTSLHRSDLLNKWLFLVPTPHHLHKIWGCRIYYIMINYLFLGLHSHRGPQPQFWADLMTSSLFPSWCVSHIGAL